MKETLFKTIIYSLKTSKLKTTRVESLDPSLLKY